MRLAAQSSEIIEDRHYLCEALRLEKVAIYPRGSFSGVHLALRLSE